MFESVIKDFAWVGLLLLIGTYLRAHVKILQKLYIPNAVIAGFVGILLGPEVLGRFCPVYIHWSEYSGQYATPLLAILFCVQFFGIRFNGKVIKRASAVWAIATITLGVQFLSAIPITKAFGLLDGFALLPQSAFYGGHGIPAVLTGIWENLGYWDSTEALTVGTTFATIGLLYGVIGGIVLINIAVRKNWLTGGSNIGKLSEEEATGYIQLENRQKIMTTVTRSQTMNPMAFHVAIVFALMLAAYTLLNGFKWLAANVPLFSSLANLNIMVPALIVSLVFGALASKTRLGEVCDEDSLKHVGSTSLEFLIASSIAITDLDVVITYGAPMLLISVIGLLLTTLCTLGLSKLWLRSNWFEHGVCMMGAYTGVLATGLMLLRIADTDMKTDASIDIITASPFWTITSQNFYLAIAPMMIVTAGGFTNLCSISAALTIGLLIFGTIFYRVMGQGSN
ncbi:MAG: hypothetical protein LIO67_02265 [Lachnospiraceae bacterium]|nr:hypothetical protein [Lachnospiraceae bacterium]